MSALDRLLAAARRSLIRGRLLEAALAGLAGLALTLLIGVGAQAAGLRPGAVALVELVTLAAVIGVVGWVFIRRLRASHTDDVEVAGWLDSAGPDVRPTLRSAVELRRDRGRFGESPELADAATQRAIEEAERRDHLDLARDRLRREVGRASLPAAGMVAAIAMVAFASPALFIGALSAIAAMDEIDEALERIPPEPRLGDIQLTLRFPEYSERAPRRLSSANGRIVALPGTEVEIETRSRAPVQEASLLVSHGEGEDGTPQRIAVRVEGRQLRTKLVVRRAGRYRFRLTTTDGELREERRGHEIELEIDEPPEVTLLDPTESPLEVNERDRVNLTFKARDDFALGEARVYWRVLGSTREGRIKLTSATSGQARFSGSAQLDLTQLELQPGDRVAYTLEVSDNDTVNGPKVGSSATQELRIYSERAHHRQVLALQEQSLDELVHILGDNLENAFEAIETNDVYESLLTKARGIVERAQRADELLRKTVAAVRKDPLGRPQVADAFDEARRELRRDARSKDRAVGAASRHFRRTKAMSAGRATQVEGQQKRMVRRLEKNVVYLADLLNDQRLIDAEALAKELRKEQEALRKALEEYKDAPSDEKRALIAEAIKDIRKRISEIMAELSQLKSSIPQDFVNQDALDTQDAQAEMDEVQRMIEEGDLDAAMEALDRMLNQTERMMAQLEEGREELSSREYSEITERAEKLWKDLGELEQDQKKLADQTEGLSREVQERMKERLGDSEAFVAKQVARLEDAKRRLEMARPGAYMPDLELHELTERRLDDGIRALQEQDFGAAKEVLDKAHAQMTQLEAEARRRSTRARRFGDIFGATEDAKNSERALGKARPQVEAVLKDIDELTPSPESLMSPEERGQMSQLQKKQGKLQKRANSLNKDLQSLGEQLPIVGPEVQGMLQGAEDSMKEAQSQLGKSDAPGALSQERAALEKLRQLKQELEKMGEQGGGKQGGGVPLPFGQRPRGGGEGNEDGGREPQGKVEIPKADQYRAPAEFREDILEAAKQGTVEDYRDAVRRYYEELVK